jgi:hypothetical protein
MVKRERVERIELLVEQIELPVEQISDVPGPVDHARASRRVWTAMQRTAQAAADERARSTGSSTSAAIVTSTPGTTFRRVVDVPGAYLETTLDAWWSRSSHDDGHLRVDRLTHDHDVFEFDGFLRVSVLSRRIPVEVRLSPFRTSWTFLELTPRRATHPSRAYFRVGHASLDRFVAALAALSAREGAPSRDTELTRCAGLRSLD